MCRNQKNVKIGKHLSWYYPELSNITIKLMQKNPMNKTKDKPLSQYYPELSNITVKTNVEKSND